MPILPEETAQFPAGLLESPPHGLNSRQWWAVYTKARQEKALARELLRLEIPFYLPLVAKTLVRRGRRLKSLIPLFSGYVFLCASEEERLRSLATNRISKVIPVTDQVQLFRDLRQVRQLIEAGAPLTVESRLTAGKRVRIRSGALMGLEGIVEGRRGACRLVVAVTFLQQGVSVEIDDFTAEPLD